MYKPEDECRHVYQSGKCTFCGANFMESTDEPIITRNTENRKSGGATHRDHNIGESDYASKKIQPWDIWLEYKLNPWDADIIKRVLRTKNGESRTLDYRKIIHICQERISQLAD